MADKKSLKEIRRIMAAFVNDFGRGQQLDSKTITESFIKAHAKEINESLDSLVRVALSKLLGDVERHQLRLKDSELGIDLFSGYSIPSFGVLPVSSQATGSAKVHKRFQDMTLPELEDWCGAKISPRRRNTSTIEEVMRLIEFVRPFMDNQTTLSQGMRAAKHAK